MNWKERKTYYNKCYFTEKDHLLCVKNDVPIRLDGHWRTCASYIKEICNPTRVLDCGCATGGIVYGLQTMESPIDAYGFDLAEYAIARAVPEIRNRLLLLDVATERLPFDDGYFDLIHAFDFFEHQDDEHLPVVIDEIRRVSSDKILMRQPMTHFLCSAEQRPAFLQSFNNITHKERIALIDNHKQIMSSVPDKGCPYHPQERGRKFWVDLFESYGYEEVTLDEKYYKYPNALHLCSFNTLYFQRNSGQSHREGELLLDFTKEVPE